MDQGEIRTETVSHPRKSENKTGSVMGMRHIQYPAMNSVDLAATIGCQYQIMDRKERGEVNRDQADDMKSRGT